MEASDQGEPAQAGDRWPVVHVDEWTRTASRRLGPTGNEPGYNQKWWVERELESRLFERVALNESPTGGLIHRD